jgi:hypothetical protein
METVARLGGPAPGSGTVNRGLTIARVNIASSILSRLVGVQGLGICDTSIGVPETDKRNCSCVIARISSTKQHTYAIVSLTELG